MIIVKIMSHLIATRTFLINMSCIMGFFTWYIITESRTITTTLSLPLYFSHLNDQINVVAPETVDLALAGTRRLLRDALRNGAICINSTKLNRGKQILPLRPENFLLPTAIKVINYKPIEINIT